MFKNIKKEKFSLRKYKNGRTDSKLIGENDKIRMYSFDKIKMYK